MGRQAFRRSAGLSLVLHAAALFGLSLLHPVRPPEAAVAAFEVVMATPDADTAPPVPKPAEPAQQPAVAAPAPEATAPPVVSGQAPQPAAPAPPNVHKPPRPASRAPAQSRTPPPAPASRPATPGASAPPAPSRPDATATEPPRPPLPQAAAEAPARTSPAWLAGVSEWLQAHRTYPEMARRRGQEGTVVLRFTAAHDGQVLEVNLVRGSGSEVLDLAAQTLLRDAHLPPFPSDMPMPRQSVTVPIRYRLD